MCFDWNINIGRFQRHQISRQKSSWFVLLPCARCSE